MSEGYAPGCFSAIALDTESAREILQMLYNEKQMPIKEIAPLFGRSRSSVRRAMLKWGLVRRNRAEAQRIAIQTGRHQHPTRGKNHRPETVEQISRSRAEAWKETDDAFKEEHRSTAKKYWDQMSDEAKLSLKKAAHRAIRKAAKEGSRLEKWLLTDLYAAGAEQGWHAEAHLPLDIVTGYEGGRMHIDIAITGNIPGKRIALEIDGPSHYSDIWGAEALERVKKGDAVKTATLQQAGWRVIRLVQKRKNLSPAVMREASELVMDAIAVEEPLIVLEI